MREERYFKKQYLASNILPNVIFSISELSYKAAIRLVVRGIQLLDEYQKKLLHPKRAARTI